MVKTQRKHRHLQYFLYFCTSYVSGHRIDEPDMDFWMILGIDPVASWSNYQQLVDRSPVPYPDQLTSTDNRREFWSKGGSKISENIQKASISC